MAFSITPDLEGQGDLDGMKRQSTLSPLKETFLRLCWSFHFIRWGGHKLVLENKICEECDGLDFGKPR
jgi:hypothetical protein